MSAELNQLSAILSGFRRIEWEGLINKKWKKSLRGLIYNRFEIADDQKFYIYFVGVNDSMERKFVVLTRELFTHIENR